MKKKYEKPIVRSLGGQVAVAGQVEACISGSFPVEGCNGGSGNLAACPLGLNPGGQPRCTTGAIATQCITGDAASPNPQECNTGGAVSSVACKTGGFYF